MNGANFYLKHTDRYLDLLEQFMGYIASHKTSFDLPNKANIVMFDATDRKFSDYSLRVLNRLTKQNERNIVEVTKTGSRIIPWRVSKTL